MRDKLYSLELPYINSVDTFARVADQPWAIFLDSGARANHSRSSKHADFDVLAIKPSCTLVFDGDSINYRKGGNEETLYGDPLAILQAAIPKVSEEIVDEIDCAYLPGALGYFSYDLARQYEDLPCLARNDENLPEMAIGIYSVVVVVDHTLRKTQIISLGSSADVLSIVEEWRDLIEVDTNFQELGFDEFVHFAPDARGAGLICGLLEDNMNAVDYHKAFQTVRDYTLEGDCYQVNLSKRFSTQVTGDAWETYQFLRFVSPAPYGAYMNLPFAQILSNSPESFIQCRNRHVVTSPIKGTRARDHEDADNDKFIAKVLAKSPKDRAENLMIVDLMRNDLSKSCELKSVKVPKLFAVHSFANVHHLISTITGTLKKGLHALDLLRDCFPGGSITGAPKIRAMEIIEELESHRRGLYCGAIGYVGVDGSLETNIAIRTIVIKDGIARFSAGGGLVIDSDVNAEHQELLDKASMMTKSLFR